ncbi:MAG: hypothetical protein FWB74_00355 [Defluviitaleaceae bacterium]|nr:hypothetical protein [Defluviitaleaceae bacterium]
MNRGGIGAASIILVFVVLCLVIFAVVALRPALTDRELVEQEVELVQGFFAADALAERIVAELIHMDYAPAELLGIEITSYWDWDLFLEIASFGVPINETQILHVEIGLDFGHYQIFQWRMVSLREWEAYDGIDVWQGDDDFFIGW